MKTVPFKYGLVIGIFSSVIMLLVSWMSPSISAGLLPYAIVLGITFGLMMIYGITKKNELEGDEKIAYHEAFISSFVIGFVGIMIFYLAFSLTKGYVFPEITEIQKAKTLESYDNLIDYYKSKLKEDGSEAAKMMADYTKYRNIEEGRDYNPMSKDNVLNTLISIVLMAGLFSAILSLISALFGYKTKIIN